MGTSFWATVATVTGTPPSPFLAAVDPLLVHPARIPTSSAPTAYSPPLFPDCFKCRCSCVYKWRCFGPLSYILTSNWEGPREWTEGRYRQRPAGSWSGQDLSQPCAVLEGLRNALPKFGVLME